MESEQINQELEEAYLAFSKKLFSFAGQGSGIDIFNFDEVIKEVMEAVEALGQAKNLSGKQKCGIAQSFATRVLHDLYEKNKVTKEFHAKSVEIINYMGPAIFTVVSMASQGKVLINQAMEVAGCNTKCCNVL